MTMTTNRTAQTTAIENIAAWTAARYAKYLAAGATDAEAITGVRQDMIALASR